MAEIYQLPDSTGNNGNASIPFSIPIGFGGMGNGWGNGFGNGMNGVFDIFALALVASMFGGWGSSNVDYLKKALDDDEKKKEEQTYVIPEK